MTSKNININLFKYANEEDDLFSDKDSLILSKKITKRSKGPKTPSTDSKEKSKKKLWTESEDKLLLELIAQHGQKWTLIGKLIGGRKCKQVRDRYLNYLNPEVKTTPFTAEEDAQLISLFNKLGNKWKQIATNMKGRSESQVKNRYYRHLKQLLSPSVSESSPFEISKYNSICSNSTEATEQNDEEDDEEEEQLDFAILNKEVQDIYFPTFEEQEQEKPSYSCFQTEFFRNETFLVEEFNLSEEFSFFKTGAIKDLSSFENQFVSAQNLIFDDEEIQVL